MNRDRHHAAFLPQEEVEHRKLYSEPPAEKKSGDDKPRDRRMIRRLWAGIGVLAFVVVLLVSIQLYVVIPRPGEEMQMELYCVKVDYNGRIIEEGQGNFRGHFIHYGGSKSDKFIIEEGYLLDDLHWKDASREVWTDEDGNILLGRFTEIGSNKDWCVIHYDWYYYICSTQENFDPAEIAGMSNIIDAATASKIQ